MTPQNNGGEQVKAIARNIVDYARKQGAETVEAHSQISTDFELEVRNGEVENLSEADSHSIFITVSKGMKRASVSSCDFSEKALRELVDHALFLCQYTDEDPYYNLPTPDLLAKEVPDLELYDTSLPQISPNEWIQRLIELEKQSVAENPKLKSDGCFLGTNISQVALANSVGFCESMETTSVSIGTTLFAEDTNGINSGRKQSSGYSSYACHASDLENNQAIAEKAANRVLRKLGAQKPKTGVFPVYFEPSVARSLIGTLLTGIKGSLIYRRESYLAGKLGQQIAAENVTIFEDPYIKRGLNSRSFDSEGVRTHKRHLVDHGKLETFLLSCYSAKKLGMVTTGHSGGYGNISLEPGNLSEEEILKAMGTGLWLTELSGQGIKLTTGDYSRGASGLWVENGKVSYPVSEFTLSSNLDSMLKHIEYIGKHPELGRPIVTPGLMVSEMTLSGTN